MSSKQFSLMKSIDMISATILFIGGLNWGLIGFFNFNLVEWIFGGMAVATRIVYALVGISALYEAVMWKAIQNRWECRGFFRRHESAAS